ncbi:MAG: hypothetical protein ACK5SX_02785 [Sandaracinobacter sp.]
MKTVDNRRMGWFIGAVFLIALAGELLLRGLFWLAGHEDWYDANDWAKALILAPFFAFAYHRSGVELFGLRRRMGWKHD